MLPVPVTLVLVAPQDLVNVASCVRLCRNFGVHALRVVAPEVELDAYRIEGIAHHTADFIAAIRTYPTLADALADQRYAMVLTGRERTAKRRVLRPREAAAELLGRGTLGPVALVAGREDKGLTNDELDRCQALVTISTDPSYSSLNLAQAVGVMLHELWTAAGGDAIPFKPPRREAPPATGQEHELLFADWTRALWAIEFFKTRQPEGVARSLREILFRAGLDQREAKLLRAMGIEVVKYLERKGIPVERPPGDAAGPGAPLPAAGSDPLGTPEGTGSGASG